MSKNILKVLFSLCIILIFLYGFSSSYNYSSIDNLSYVVGLGIDLTDDKKSYTITFEFTNFTVSSQDSSTEDSSPILDTISAPSLDTAINMINVYLAKEVNLAHCKVIVLSEDVAKKGVLPLLSEIMNNSQFRQTSNIIVCKEKASDYLKNSASSLDKMLSKYYDIFPSSGKYTGYTSNITLGKFYNAILDKNTGNLAILGGINKKSFDATTPEQIKAGESSINGERNTENIGLAVFRDDKYIGDLSASETLYHSILSNEVDKFVFSIKSPENKDDNIDVSLRLYTPVSIDVDISGDKPIINIEIYLNGRLMSIRNNLDYSEQKTLTNISDTVSKDMEKNITDYLYKTSKDYGCDIDKFYLTVKRKFLTIGEWKNFNWAEKYPNSTFNVKIESNIDSSFIVTEQ